MHELTKRIMTDRDFGNRSFENFADKIITDWLEKKTKSFIDEPMWREVNIRKHFGLSRKSCKCGACEKNEEIHWSKASSGFFSLAKFCPSCGEELRA